MLVVSWELVKLAALDYLRRVYGCTEWLLSP